MYNLCHFTNNIIWGQEKRQMHLGLQEPFLPTFCETLRTRAFLLAPSSGGKGHQQSKSTKDEPARFATRLQLSPAVFGLLSRTDSHAVHSSRRTVCRTAPARARLRTQRKKQSPYEPPAYVFSL